MNLIPVLDKDFKELPEIKHLCPAVLDVKTCKKTETGIEFNIGKLFGNDGKTYGIYPYGNEFARHCCEVIFFTKR